ncbi:hypothetical protein BDA99DRAFT_308369 [Phascolomyces articulosus]|uniref:Uncharacterized protein n=1 Tax=Phascolomyces articulosus TaxID=60185 RepID=A0AAD5K721_9FUNG|nr:hypothetical protein BDA99DRAFT_308369 [Phascolomyces articulosus]
MCKNKKTRSCFSKQSLRVTKMNSAIQLKREYKENAQLLYSDFFSHIIMATDSINPKYILFAKYMTECNDSNKIPTLEELSERITGIQIYIKIYIVSGQKHFFWCIKRSKTWTKQSFFCLHCSHFNKALQYEAREHQYIMIIFHYLHAKVYHLDLCVSSAFLLFLHYISYKMSLLPNTDYTCYRLRSFEKRKRGFNGYGLGHECVDACSLLIMGAFINSRQQASE